MEKAALLIDSKTQHNIDAWLKGDYDQETKDEIKRLQKENPKELIDAFYTHLAFGTGGLRGLMGIGTNRMNLTTVRNATQGLANYISSQTPKGAKSSVVVGYDTRNHSKEFAEETAKVLAGNGITVYLFDSFRPVALVSFALIKKKSIAAVMITASHNPREYNGYKVWWEHGGQVLPPHDKGIIDEVNKITSSRQIKMTPLPNPLVHLIGKEIDLAYLKAIASLQNYPQDNLKKGKELSIAYTPLHGGGISIVPEALYSWGFTRVAMVEKQIVPDGNFPTVKTPNPEYPENLALGIEMLKKIKGDILIANDADCDRVGVAAMHEGKPYIFTGNELACIATAHLCRALKENHKIPPKPMILKTIVTTELVAEIAKAYGITCLDLLTGFKYIGEKISQWEDEKQAPVTTHHFVFGAEESYGYLIGTHVRDKDAVVMSALFAEAALHVKLKGQTLVDFLFEIYHKHGVFREKILSIEFEGKEGVDKMKRIMDHFRKSPPSTLGGVEVEEIEDYTTHTRLFTSTGHHETLTLPASDVLRFWLADKTKITIRPSGTEPKIKVYAEIRDKHFVGTPKDIQRAIESCDLRLNTLLSSIKQMISSI